jgi:hypothetical protein
MQKNNCNENETSICFFQEIVTELSGVSCDNCLVLRLVVIMRR